MISPAGPGVGLSSRCESDVIRVEAGHRDDIIISRVFHRDLKVWLSKEGSPSCRITRPSFSNEISIGKVELSGFKKRFHFTNAL
ncbi:hypothetical protein J4Q44_G00360620 [Coregonus suidteri]|uniref:Uncharacterized protein n=1 Tax=Coregonus suidteri TaxID=861788 RepID=A0AAN8QBM2_9TELE